MNHLYNDIIVPNPDKCITTDASSYGWVAVMEPNSTGGLFSTSEMKEYINVLELKAILFGLKTLAKGLTKIHIKVLTDNSVAVACINKFGTSRSQECDSISKEIWQWASVSSIWLYATHLPGIQNMEAEFESWKYEIHTEWKLNESAFHFIYGELGFSPSIHLFATRINIQLRTFVSYRPDPNCVAVNVFFDKLGKRNVPGISSIYMFIQNPSKKQDKGISIAPDWSSQPFYPRLIETSLQVISIPPRKRNAYLPSQPSLPHPLHRKLSLLACLVDGQQYINKGCGRPYHQFLGRKYKKAILDIFWSMERVLSRS